MKCCTHCRNTQQARICTRPLSYWHVVILCGPYNSGTSKAVTSLLNTNHKQLMGNESASLPTLNLSTRSSLSCQLHTPDPFHLRRRDTIRHTG
jgi:hypothetical protein